MKKICLVIMILVLFCSPAIAEIFVHDDGTRLTVSWPATGAFYYDVALENLTTDSSMIEGPVFDSVIIISRLAYHNIYGITVRAYNMDGERLDNIGEKYITFALDESSGNCVCVCPEIPKKVFFGVIAEGWWTGITVNNTGSESQSVIIKVGSISRIVVVSSHSTEIFLLSDLVDDNTPKSYPIAYETESPDVGVTVLIGDQVNNVCAQN